MNENIKTGKEIIDKYYFTRDFIERAKIEEEQLVPLSWLKEPFYSQLEWHLDEILKGNSIDLNVGSIKRMFLSLLEETK